MLQYLNNVLGLSAHEEPWAEEKRLPLYLRGNRTYTVLAIDDLKLLLIHSDQSEFSLPAFQKHTKKLKEYWQGEIVLCFEKLTSYQRKALIEQRLAFIVPGSQVYVPSLGIVLQERMPSMRKKAVHLSAGSQSLLVYLLTQKTGPQSKAEIARQTGRQAMSITRAVRELSDLQLVSIEHTGRCDYVSLVSSGKELYKRAQPYLIDPVQKSLFVKNLELLGEFPVSGETALSELSMLNPPAVECRAVGRSNYAKLKDNIQQVDPAWNVHTDYIRLEIWSYDPQPLAKYGRVDVISLLASLSSKKDERIQAAVKEILEGYKW